MPGLTVRLQNIRWQLRALFTDLDCDAFCARIINLKPLDGRQARQVSWDWGPGAQSTNQSGSNSTITFRCLYSTDHEPSWNDPHLDQIRHDFYYRGFAVNGA